MSIFNVEYILQSATMQEQSNELLESLSNDQSSELLQIEDFIDGQEFSFYEDSQNINSSFSEYLPPMAIEKIQNIKIPKFIDQYCRQYQKINPFRHFKIPPSKTVPKSACSKIIHEGERIIECADCGMDQSCVICLNCFENGNHEGHKYVVKRAAGGCCDCGDIEAWKEQGFCKKHTGSFEDFKIEQSQFKKFYEITDGLFYYYFHCRITESPSSNSFTKSLISFLSRLNQSDLYYNKLTSMALNRKLPKPYDLNQTLNSRTILQNILTFKISGNLLERWWDFFMTLFSYYPFKLDLLTIYTQKYSLLMDGNKQCKNICSLITCQLLTSYRLIEQYCQSNTRPLASLSEIPTETGKIWQFYIMIINDLKMINKLAGKAPLAYWTIQIDFGFDNILNYQQIIWRKIEKYSSSIESTLIMSKFVHFCQLEKKFIEIYVDMLKIIEPNSPLLKKIIIYFYDKCAHSSEARLVLLTLRVYQRCLTLALFKYFQCNLAKIEQQNIQRLLDMLPNVKKSDFEQVCLRIIHDIQQTYFLWSKCMTETGFGQTLYNFIYFYRSQSSLIMYTDIICLKIFYLFMGAHRFINFKKIIEYNLLQTVPQQIPELYQEQLSKKRGFYSSVLQQINYLFSAQIPQIYIAYSVNSSDCQLYSHQISEILDIIFSFRNNRVSYKDYKNLQQSIFHQKNIIMDKWIKDNTTFNKSKKQFERKKQGQESSRNIKILSWANTSLNIQLNPHKLSLQLQRADKKIFGFIFCKETIESLIETLMKLYSKESLRTCGNAILNQLFQLYRTGLSLQIQEFNLLDQHVLTPNQDLLPSSIGKLYGIQASSKIKNNIQQEEKIKTIKSKKLQKIKNKQQQFIKNRGGIQFDQKIQQDNLEAESCCICKNQNPQQFVYLVKVQQRDHERLMKRGEGLECLTFMSCYHIFDQKCINSKFNFNKLINSMSCPLCKTSANIIIPYSINNKTLVNNFIKRMTIFSSVMTNSQNMYQQLFKSFYHYIMLASIDLNNSIKKRAKIYRLLYQIIKISITSPQLISLHKKFQQEKLNRKCKRGFDSKSERLFSQIIKETEGSNEKIFKLTTRPHDLHEDGQQQKNEEVQQIKSSQLLCWIMNWLFTQLGIPGMSQNNYPEFFKLALKYIEQKGSGSIVLPEFQQQQKTNKLLVQLPHKYTQIGNIKKCSQCQQMSSELHLCLLCGWVGCQSCHKGSLSSHINKKHGKVGALMNINNSLAIYYINTKTVYAGWLYQNQWQEMISIEKDWNQFQLCLSLYNAIERNMKLDEIPTKNRHS